MFPSDTDLIVVSPRIQIPGREFEWGVARSSGPGGQNVNKVNSKVTLRWSPLMSETLPTDVRDRFVTAYKQRLTNEGDLLLSSERYRDQPKNVEDCLAKLSELILAVAVAPKPRKKSRPTKAAKRRRVADKRINSETKQRRRKPKLED